ncbi:endonuclease G [Pseudomonas fluorescens]|jgi:endonuclease G|uniref:DNA/RNA non-specific endonuclease n=1 Tax=Pseudomonas fluorescens TaxID=294 RepID=UPI0020A1B0B2|nr:DNA/RNA non-specific endonuclease [Pseudomonas fluorescens]MCP1487814.1 endonuclease G [Pseudomonas fluorescens]
MTNEERINNLKAKLTPEMEAAVQEAFNSGRLPESLWGGFSDASLESIKAGGGLEPILGQGTPGNFEAIIKLVGRPSMLVSNDRVELQPLPKLPPQTSTLIRGVEQWIPSVGRIEFRNHHMAWGGTGWVVEHSGAGTLVVTNRHVAKLVALRNADGTGVFLRNTSGIRMGAAIDFREEVHSQVGDNSRTVALTKVQYLADDASADVALLLIEAADFALPTPMQLIEDTESVQINDLVALIGYPAYDSRNNADAQANYFGQLYEVKRFAPGLIMQPPGANQVLSYDCTSLGGNSGSPVIRLSDGKVVGLHFSGAYLQENSAVPAARIRELVRGLRPVSVQLQAQAHTTALVEAADGSHNAAWFSQRKGFDTAFLKTAETTQTVKTPWPVLSADLELSLAVPSDTPEQPNELRYTHFGVKYSATHKLPLITAVNIDGAAAVRIKRGTDKWFADERIPRDIQLGAQNFQDEEIDRGHMVRREDPNWGSQQEAEQANFDTFHYVNAAAQHSRLNQGKALWQGLENYILDSARTHGFKACVFTGPILRKQGSEEIEVCIDGAIAPLEFWKLVATLDAEGKALHTTAYVLSQGQLLRDLLEKRSRHEAVEGIELGPYRTFQVAIVDLAEATGYDFSAYVASDPLTGIQAGQEAVAHGEPVFMQLAELSEIIL